MSLLSITELQKKSERTQDKTLQDNLSNTPHPEKRLTPSNMDVTTPLTTLGSTFWETFLFDIQDTIKKSPKIHLNSLSIAAFLSVCIMLTGMTTVTMPNWLNWIFGTSVLSAKASGIHFSFQLSLAVFTGALLGPILGTFALCLYLVTGLFFLPLFAGGGGLEYLSNPGLGFLMGMMLAAFYAGYTIRQIYKEKKPFLCSLRILGVGFFSVLVCHFAGIVYLGGLALAGHLSFADLQHWIVQYSLKPLPYDILAALTFMTCVRYTRIALYPLLY